jgi:polyisoprenoid-binding protein YceI
MSLSTMPAAVSTGISRWEIDPAHSHVEFAVKHLMIATVKGLSEGDFRLTDHLTIHGITRKVVLDVTGKGRAKDMEGNERAGFSA